MVFTKVLLSSIEIRRKSKAAVDGGCKRFDANEDALNESKIAWKKLVVIFFTKNWGKKTK